MNQKMRPNHGEQRDGGSPSSLQIAPLRPAGRYHVRLACFTVTNAGTVSISVRYVIFLEPEHTDPVRIERGPSLHVQPGHPGVFSVNAPRSSTRWQLAVGFGQETSLLKWCRWYHTRYAGSWFERLVPRFKERAALEVLSDWIEH